MTLYIAKNSDGSEIISKQPLKRYIDYNTNKGDVLSFRDTQLPPHWMLDYTDIKVNRNGEVPIDVYLTLPNGSIKRLFNISLSWEDEPIEIKL